MNKREDSNDRPCMWCDTIIRAGDWRRVCEACCNADIRTTMSVAAEIPGAADVLGVTMAQLQRLMPEVSK